MDIVSKSTGDSWSASEQNQITNELENSLTSTGQTPAVGDLFQVAKAIADYASHGDFYTDSGAASAYVLSAQASKQSPTAYVSGFRARFVVGNTNTGASTVNIAALGVKNIKRPDGSALSAGDVIVGEIIELEYNGTDFLLKKAVFEIGQVRDISRNLVIANNGSNPTFQVDIDADEVMMQNVFNISKKATTVNETADITASGANGLDTGSESSDTWYHIWIIGKDDGTVDSLLSLSSTAPTMPSGYTFKALVGAMFNDSGSDFINIVQENTVVRTGSTSVLSGGTATTLTVVNVTEVVPPTAKRLYGMMNVLADGAGGSLVISDANNLGLLSTSNSSNGISSFTYFEASIDLNYKVAGTGASAGISITGWKY